MSAFPNASFDPRPDIAAMMMDYPTAMAEQGLIGNLLFPTVEVDVQAGNYFYTPIKEIITPASGKRNSDGSYQRISTEMGERTFATDEYGLEKPLDQRRARQYPTLPDAETYNATQVRNKVMQADEIRKAAIAMNTTTFSGQTTAAGTVWSNHASSDPIENVHDGKLALRARCGLVANVGYCAWPVFEHLRVNANIIAAVQGAGAGQRALQGDLSVELVASALGLKKLLVGGMIKNSANIGQTAVIADIWDPTIFGLAYIANPGDVESPSAFRQFHWGADGSQVYGVIESYEEPQSRAIVHRCRHEVQEQSIITEAVELITGVTS